jgi:ABC-type Na+ efflux pump permease subunit
LPWPEQDCDFGSVLLGWIDDVASSLACTCGRIAMGYSFSFVYLSSFVHSIRIFSLLFFFFYIFIFSMAGVRERMRKRLGMWGLLLLLSSVLCCSCCLSRFCLLDDKQ